jgi:hypothetical protein
VPKDGNTGLELVILPGDRAVLDVAAVQLHAQRGEEIDVTGEFAPVHEGQAGGAIAAVQIGLGESGGGRTGRGDAEVFVDEVAAAEGGEDEDLCPGAVDPVAETVAGGEDPRSPPRRSFALNRGSATSSARYSRSPAVNHSMQTGCSPY